MKRKSEALKKSDNNLEVETSSQVETFQCDQCDHSFKTENGLKIHIGKTHKDLIPQLDGQTEDITTGLVVKTDKEAEVQTEPGYVTVAVKEVLKTYEIFVKESLKKRIDEELESFWKGNGTNGFSVRKVQKQLYGRNKLLEVLRKLHCIFRS